jgi:hypothetical protein
MSNRRRRSGSNRKIMKIPILPMMIGLLCCSPQKQESEVSRDIDLLSKMIHLPYRPIAVIWSQENTNDQGDRAIGPNDFTVISIVSFSEDHFRILKSDLEKTNDISDSVYLDELFVREWFPEHVKERFYLEGGRYRIAGNVYPAQIFAKGSFRNGISFIFNNNEIFICMNTM